ncbi:Conserved_hypothetical protein [Hexamita inflata]|uniref:Uncharacterized protein n=1 Tax=Hexamita inflata TaxID=28002 RepID=A0AA86Q4P1_9EUKA|nr:Conserved hypothetical protein [Hexamita inflata]
MITKLTIYSDYIAEVTMKTKQDQQIRVLRSDLEMFNQSLRLPENVAISRIKVKPLSFTQHIQNNPNDEFELITTEKTYRGQICQENDYLYISQDNITTKIGLNQIGQLRNISAEQYEVFQIKQSAEIQFLTNLTESNLTCQLQNQLELHFQFANQFGFPIDAVATFINRPYQKFNVISDFGFSTICTSENEALELATEFIKRQFKTEFFSNLKLVRENQIIYVLINEANLSELQKQMQEMEFKVKLDPYELQRTCLIKIPIEKSQARVAMLVNNECSVFQCNLNKLGAILNPVQIGSRYHSGLADHYVVTDKVDTMKKVKTEITEQWSGSVNQQLYVDIKINQTVQTVTDAPTILLKLAKADETTDNLENCTVTKQSASQICLIHINGKSKFSCAFKQSYQLLDFSEAGQFIQKVSDNKYEININHDELVQPLLKLLLKHLQSLSTAQLSEFILNIDFDPKTTQITNKTIHTYLTQLNLFDSIQQYQQLLKSMKQIQSTIALTEDSIIKTKSDQTRLVEQIKGVGQNKFILKTSKVMDQFIKDLRECELKIQILNQREAALKGRAGLLQKQIDEAQETVKLMVQ